MPMNVSAGNASSLTLVSCMHNTSGCMSTIHCSIRSRRAFSELTFHVAIRTVATVANRQRNTYADLARRRVAFTGSATWGASMTATACFEARFLAGGVGAASATTVGAEGAAAAAVFLARDLLGAGAAGWTASCLVGCLAGCFIARFFGGASTTGAGAGSAGAAVGVVAAVAAAFLFRFGGLSAGASGGAPFTEVIVGMARSMVRRAGAQLSTTRVPVSPIFMNSRALPGGGSDIRLKGTCPFTAPIRTRAACDE